MSKELEALENIKHYDSRVGLHEDDYKIIETALKRLENYEQNEDFNKDVLNYAYLNEQDKIKKLKALEIIKKNLCVDFFIGLDNEYVYVLKSKSNECFMPITKEQYDLLKEVLE